MSVEVNAILVRYGLKGEIPESTDFASTVNIFNASDYWRDWHRDKNKERRWV